MKPRDDNIKWSSSTEYVNTETGEIITKSEYERGNYLKLKSTKSIKITEHGNNGKKYGEIKWTTELKENPQQILEF